jgi:hypothetical protein
MPADHRRGSSPGDGWSRHASGCPCGGGVESGRRSVGRRVVRRQCHRVPTAAGLDERRSVRLPASASRAPGPTAVSSRRRTPSHLQQLCVGVGDAPHACQCHEPQHHRTEGRGTGASIGSGSKPMRHHHGSHLLGSLLSKGACDPATCWRETPWSDRSHRPAGITAGPDINGHSAMTSSPRPAPSWLRTT